VSNGPFEQSKQPKPNRHQIHRGIGYGTYGSNTFIFNGGPDVDNCIAISHDNNYCGDSLTAC
jgi:hypothetical protein